MTSPTFELVSYKLCPYVQRSVIVLLEKNVGFKRTNISLKEKPAWFQDMSPTGKVPMLIVDETTLLFESAVICEYIDEITPGSRLSHIPLDRAKQRAWIRFADTVLEQISTLYNADTATSYSRALQTLENSFTRINKETCQPFFNGDEFSMVDAAFAPVFRYFDAIEPLTSLGIFDEMTRLQQWRCTLRERSSVKAAVGPNFSGELIQFIRQKNSHLGSLLKQASHVSQDSHSNSITSI